MKLSDLTIGTRLQAGFAVIVMLLMALVITSYINFERLTTVDRLNQQGHQVVLEVEGLLQELSNIEAGQRDFSLTGNAASLDQYNSGKDGFKKYWTATKYLTLDKPHQQERLQALDAAEQRWLAEAIDPAIALRRDVIDGKAQMDAVVALEQAGKAQQGMGEMRATLLQIRDAEQSLLTKRTEEADKLRTQMREILIGGGLIAVFLGVMLAFWLARNITRPLIAAVDLAKRVALGDLTAKVEVQSKDETGQLMGALKDMNDGLVRIVTEVRAGTETIATASAQIAGGNMDLSSRTEQQASSLQETASSMEELTSTVKQNADNASQANVLAASASQVASKGGAVVAQVVDTMGSINDSSKKIVDIIGVIDGIAFQTNILALNAAVEAARAGEQGRGFAVVASEVRNLAQRSAAAAKEIKTLIGDSVEKVATGAKLVDQAGATMQEIVDSVKRVSDIVSEISAASEEQRAGIEQVSRAITQMDEVTQQNASLVEQAAAAADAMQEQSSSLAQVVSVFKLDGAQAARTSVTPARSLPQTSQPAIGKSQARPAPKLTAKAGAAVAVQNRPRPAADPATGDDWEEF